VSRSGKKRERRPRPAQRSAAAQGERPIVAVVGRPNVGKSALFNRLSGSHLAIVENVAGVTRDRLYADGNAFGRDFVLIDTGGFDPESEDPMTQGIATQVEIALSEADVVLCVLDGTMDPQPADREAIKLLRHSELPVLYLANKIDNPQIGIGAMGLYELGIDTLYPVSALHGHGIGDLEEQLAKLLPEPPDDGGEAADPNLDRVAIIGRPNAGKSSLVNRLLGEDRQLVDNRPGTTVDSVDTLLSGDAVGDGDPMVLIDTAGIRRKRSVEKGIEALSVVQAVRAIERANVVILMIDAEAGPAEQDTKIVSLALERGRSVLIALNKIDLLNGEGRKKAIENARDVLSFMPWAPLQQISAKTGRGVTALMKSARKAAVEHRRRVTTGELNRFFEQVLERHPPPTQGGRAVRIYYVTQASTRPPSFVAVTNYPDRVHFSYKRYVINQLRERFGFEAAPVRVFYRPKKKKDP